MDDLVIIALAAFIGGGLWLLVEMFLVRVWWGIFGILFPPVQWLFVILHWGKAWRPLLLQLLALLLLGLVVLQNPDIGIRQYWQQASQQVFSLGQGAAAVQPLQRGDIAPASPGQPAAGPSAAASSKTVYKCRDAEGRIAYLDRPCANPAEEMGRQLIRDVPASAAAPGFSAAAFHCDGRTHCSEMTSCEEAMYFLRHCPGVKMDGNGDGVPCEQQWCGDGL